MTYAEYADDLAIILGTISRATKVLHSLEQAAGGINLSKKTLSTIVMTHLTLKICGYLYMLQY